MMSAVSSALFNFMRPVPASPKNSSSADMPPNAIFIEPSCAVNPQPTVAASADATSALRATSQAIAHGATHVRVGSAVLGPRPAVQ